MKSRFSFLALGLTLSFGLAFSSCSDFFEIESSHYIDSDKEHLNNATDTIYSMIGILNKLQAIGDRTILLGELRGDLMDVTDVTSADLRDVALFKTLSDDNIYNQPIDYYAIINNCNYFIAHADTALKNNRNDQIFMSEFAAVKVIRAWTYLQLVTTYGKVPFVTEPILNSEEALLDYPMYDIQQVCDYFLNEDDLFSLRNVPLPKYGKIKDLPSEAFYFPIDVVIGDLYLWSHNYLYAAAYYHAYLTTKEGHNFFRPTGISRTRWESKNGPVTWDTKKEVNYGEWYYFFGDGSEKSTPDNSELITIIPIDIPGDSATAESHNSNLVNVFNSTSENDYKASAKPSQYMIDLSAAQNYCHYYENQLSYAPKNLPDYCSGDLRLQSIWSSHDYYVVKANGESYYCQYIDKYRTNNIHIYRLGQIYLRFAEAINRAGYPRYAFEILKTGVNSEVLRNTICPEYRNDSVRLATAFSFPSSYITFKAGSSNNNANTLGIHARGCGYTVADTLYAMPHNDAITDSLAQIAWQIEKVEDLIVDELALECAFEGIRYYDLMRVALHRDDPTYLDSKIKARRGEGKDSGIATDLTKKENWFLHWNNQIGY